MPKPKQKRIIVLQSSNHDSESGSLRDASAHSTKVTLKNLIVANGTGESQDGSTESADQDILTGGDYSKPSPDSIIDTGNGNDVFRSTLGIINTGNSNNSITPSIEQGIGTNFITGGNGNDSITTFRDEGMGLNFITPDNGNDVFFATTRDRLIGTLGGNDTITYAMVEGTTRDRLIGTLGGNDVFFATTRDRLIGTLGGNGFSGSDGADTLLASYFGGNGSSGSDGADTLRASYFGGNGSSESGNSVDTLLGNYSEPSRKTEQFHGFPELSISGNNTSRLTSTEDRYSDDNNSLESNYRATLYGGPGEDLFNARSDTSSPLPLPATNQSPGFTDTITDQLFSSQTGTSAGTYIPVAAETVDSWSSYGGMDSSLNGNNQILIIEPPTDQLFSVGVGSVETAIFLPVVIPARERAAHFSGASSSDEAWAALGNISQLTSGEMTLPSLPGEFDQIKVKKLPWSD
jgi:hypothetical protein